MRRKSLTLIAVGIAVMLLALGAAPPPDDLSKLVEECYPPPAKIVQLARQSHSESRMIRYAARSDLIPLLRVGMTRRQVEALLGPADNDYRERRDENGNLLLSYYCMPKLEPPTGWW